MKKNYQTWREKSSDDPNTYFLSKRESRKRHGELKERGGTEPPGKK